MAAQNTDQLMVQRGATIYRVTAAELLALLSGASAWTTVKKVADESRAANVALTVDSSFGGVAMVEGDATFEAGPGEVRLCHGHRRSVDFESLDGRAGICGGQRDRCPPRAEANLSDSCTGSAASRH